jgi:hypothetical protein
MHAQPSLRRVPMALAVGLLVTAGLRAQAPAPPPLAYPPSPIIQGMTMQAVVFPTHKSLAVFL